MLHVMKKDVFHELKQDIFNSFIKCVSEPSGNYTYVFLTATSLLWFYMVFFCFVCCFSFKKVHAYLSGVIWYRATVVLCSCIVNFMFEAESFFPTRCECVNSHMFKISNKLVTFMCNTNNMFWLNTLDHEKIYLLN